MCEYLIITDADPTSIGLLSIIILNTTLQLLYIEYPVRN